MDYLVTSKKINPPAKSMTKKVSKTTAGLIDYFYYYFNSWKLVPGQQEIFYNQSPVQILLAGMVDMTLFITNTVGYMKNATI